METLVLLSRIDSPKKAVEHLRHLAAQGTALNWPTAEEIAGIHFQDEITDLPFHFRHRNDTGIAVRFDELSQRLEASLVADMTRPSHPLTAEEAETCAYRIALLRIMAGIVRALHNRGEATVTIDGIMALGIAA